MPFLGALRWLDRNIEKFIIAVSFAIMAAIVVGAVIQRFVFNSQVPWSGSIPIYMFLWVTWIGAAYNVRTRTQLRFSEFRNRLPYTGQFICNVLDTVLWVAVATIIIYYSAQQTQIVHRNFAVVQGTEDLQQWWFYLATPIGWSLVIIRSIQNLIEDIQTYRAGRSLAPDTALFVAD